MMTDLVADVVTEVLVPDTKERQLIDLYADDVRMNLIGEANIAATQMAGPAKRIGAGWWALVGATGVAGVTLAATGHRVSGGFVGGVAALGAGILGGMLIKKRVASMWKSTWALD